MLLKIKVFVILNYFYTVSAQADGNPHVSIKNIRKCFINIGFKLNIQNWDRARRCDQQDYDPPCGPCEGIGGIPWGSDNDQIDLTTCSVVSGPDEVEDPLRPVWGTQWTLPIAYEILIGKKTDPFCFTSFPGADSVEKFK